MTSPRKTLLAFLVPLLLAAEAFALSREIPASVLGDKWQRVFRSKGFDANTTFWPYSHIPRQRFYYRDDGTARMDLMIEKTLHPSPFDTDPLPLGIPPELGKLLRLNPAKTNILCLADELSSALTLLEGRRQGLSTFARIAAACEPQEDCPEKEREVAQALYLIVLFHEKTGITIDFDAAERLVGIERGKLKAGNGPRGKMTLSAPELIGKASVILNDLGAARMRFLMRGIEWGYFPEAVDEGFLDHWTRDTSRRTAISYRELRPEIEHCVHLARVACTTLRAHFLAEAILYPQSDEARYLGDHPSSPGEAPRWLAEQSGLPVTNTAPIFADVFSSKTKYRQVSEVSDWESETLDKPPAEIASPGFTGTALASLRKRVTYPDEMLPVLATNAVLHVRTNLVARWSRDEIRQIAKDFSRGDWDTNRLEGLVRDLARRSGLPAAEVRARLAPALFKEYDNKLNRAIQSSEPPPFHREKFAEECADRFLGIVQVPEDECRKRIARTVDHARMVVAERLARRAGDAFQRQAVLDGTVADEIRRLRDRIAQETGVPPERLEPLVKKEIESRVEDREEHLADLREERRENAVRKVEDVAEELADGEIAGYQEKDFLDRWTRKLVAETGLPAEDVRPLLEKGKELLDERLALLREPLREIQAMARSGLYPTPEEREDDLLDEYSYTLSDLSDLDDNLVEALMKEAIEAGWQEFKRRKPCDWSDVRDPRRSADLAERHAEVTGKRFADTLEKKILTGEILVPEDDEAFVRIQQEALLRAIRPVSSGTTNSLRFKIESAIGRAQRELWGRELDELATECNKATGLIDIGTEREAAEPDNAGTAEDGTVEDENEEREEVTPPPNGAFLTTVPIVEEDESAKLARLAAPLRDIRAMARSGLYATAEDREEELVDAYRDALADFAGLPEERVVPLLRAETAAGWAEHEKGVAFRIEDIEDEEKREEIQDRIEDLKSEKALALRIELCQEIVEGRLETPEEGGAFVDAQAERILKETGPVSPAMTNSVHLDVNVSLTQAKYDRSRKLEKQHQKDQAEELRRATNNLAAVEQTLSKLKRQLAETKERAAALASKSKPAPSPYATKDPPGGNHVAQNIGLLALLAVLLSGVFLLLRHFRR